MDETLAADEYTAVSATQPRWSLIASGLGIVGGAGAAGGMWLPLATLAGLGAVGPFDYSRSLVYPTVAIAALTAIFSLARCFRLALLTAGILCGLVAAMGIELFQGLRDVLSLEGSDAAQMARAMLAHSSLRAGAYVLPLCCLACVAAGLLGSGIRRLSTGATTTSES